MIIKYADLKAHPGGMSKITLVVNIPPQEMAKDITNIQEGKAYSVEIKPYRHEKSRDQLSAIWGKIGEIANAVGASKEEVYHLMLRRYGPSKGTKISADELERFKMDYAIVDVHQITEDNEMFVIGYKGLSRMNTYEASTLLDGILSECKDIGISTEIRHD